MMVGPLYARASTDMPDAWYMTDTCSANPVPTPGLDRQVSWVWGMDVEQWCRSCLEEPEGPVSHTASTSDWGLLGPKFVPEVAGGRGVGR